MQAYFVLGIRDTLEFKKKKKSNFLFVVKIKDFFG